MPEACAELTVERQEADPASTLSFYRTLLAMRGEATGGLGTEVTMLVSPPGTLTFRRGEADSGLVCMVNCSARPTSVPPEAGELLISSGPGLVDGPRGARHLPANTAAWFRPT